MGNKHIPEIFDKRIPKSETFEGVDLETLDRDQLLLVAMSYRRAYHTSQKNNLMWKYRQAHFNKWWRDIKVRPLIRLLTKNVPYCPLNYCLTDYNPRNKNNPYLHVFGEETQKYLDRDAERCHFEEIPEEK